MMIIYVFGGVEHITKWIQNQKTIQILIYSRKTLFKDYYNKPLNKINKNNYQGVEYVAYDKQYDDEAFDNDEYDKKNDEIDLIEKHFILMYIHRMNQKYYKLTEEVSLIMMIH